jgi:hypothetical protein
MLKGDVLFVSGSLRRGSYNTALLGEAHELPARRTGRRGISAGRCSNGRLSPAPSRFLDSKARCDGVADVLRGAGDLFRVPHARATRRDPLLSRAENAEAQSRRTGECQLDRGGASRSRRRAAVPSGAKHSRPGARKDALSICRGRLTEPARDLDWRRNPASREKLQADDEARTRVWRLSTSESRSTARSLLTGVEAFGSNSRSKPGNWMMTARTSASCLKLRRLCTNGESMPRLSHSTFAKST